MTKDSLPQLPASPGVYFFLNEEHKPIYIGKASNLKSRVSSYFRNFIEDRRISEMVKNASELQYINTSSDIEALIMESIYIKKYDPKYNVLLKDDKQYFFINITDDIFPRIFITHQTHNISAKNYYIGPFTSGRILKDIILNIRDTYPYCTCKSNHKRACLNSSIGKCPGYCCNISYPNRDSYLYPYSKNIKHIKSILEGFDTDFLNKIKEDSKTNYTYINKNIEAIKKVGQKNNYEKNIIFGNTAISEIKKLAGINDTPRRIECYDIAHMQGAYASGSMVVIEDKKLSSKDYRLFNIKDNKNKDDISMMSEVIERRLKHNEWPLPQIIIVDGGLAQIRAAKKKMEEKDIHDIPVIGLTKNIFHKPDHITLISGDKIDIKDLNRDLSLLIAKIDSEAHRFAINQYRRRHRKSLT